MKYPDIEGEAMARDAEIAKKAEMFDKFVQHIIDKPILMSRAEYEMLGLGDDADMLIARALSRMMEKNGHGGR
jgi:hypothetical protein